MANVTNTITASLSIDGVVFDMQNTFTVTSATDAYVRRLSVTTTEVEILGVNATVSAGEVEAVDSFVIWNNSTKNTIRVRFTETASGQTAIFRIPPGRFMTWGNNQYSVNNTGGAFAAYVGFASVYVSAEADEAPIMFIVQHD